jgi:NRAMP (natural resistance-associated macrophage protein)-like metal ion transporter
MNDVDGIIRRNENVDVDGKGEIDEDVDDVNNNATPTLWSPSGSYLKDFIFFSGPGWFVSIAYVDPGNYQADIQAGATSQYNLLFALWWTGILSIYVQILCVRLAFYGKLTLSQAQAQNSTKTSRYFHWAIAEFSTIITDLPGVVGFGIALNYFFGWPYYIGVLLSLLTTMLFLGTLNLKGGMRVLEIAIAIFVAIMSIALFVEMDFVNPDAKALFKGWGYGFIDLNSSDIFSIAGILGSVVMPHNLYLHTAAVQIKSQQINQSPDVIHRAVHYCSVEPIAPILISFFINMAVVAIAAESVYGQTDNADQVGLTDFCSYFQSLKGGCLLWAIALLAAGQSGAITTTYTGHCVMDGFLSLQIPIALRSIVTRLMAIVPGVVVSVLFPDSLNNLVNIVNALLGLLLPFAFTPLVKFNCSPSILGENASKGLEKCILYAFAMAVWAINATTISAKGGGFFGDILPGMEPSVKKVVLVIIQVLLQLFYAWWNFSTLFSRDGYDIIKQQPSDSADDSGLPNESQTEIEIT